MPIIEIRELLLAGTLATDIVKISTNATMIEIYTSRAFYAKYL